jgi:HEPN domain-containing protein
MTRNLKKQLFNKNYASELLGIAKGDLTSAEALCKANSGRPENVVFLAQQSVEKAVKAALIHLEISFPLVHDLGILVALLPDDKAPPHGFSLAELNPFASVRRYEEGPIPLSEEEIKGAIDVARSVIHWADNLIFKK